MNIAILSILCLATMASATFNTGGGYGGVRGGDGGKSDFGGLRQGRLQLGSGKIIEGQSVHIQTVPVPVPVTVERHVPVAVPRPYVVHVPRPYPVHITKRVPVPVTKTVGVPVTVYQPIIIRANTNGAGNMGEGLRGGLGGGNLANGKSSGSESSRDFGGGKSIGSRSYLALERGGLGGKSIGWESIMNLNGGQANNGKGIGGEGALALGGGNSGQSNGGGRSQSDVGRKSIGWESIMNLNGGQANNGKSIGGGLSHSAFGGMEGDLNGGKSIGEGSSSNRNGARGGAGDYIGGRKSIGGESFWLLGGLNSGKSIGSGSDFTNEGYQSINGGGQGDVGRGLGNGKSIGGGSLLALEQGAGNVGEKSVNYQESSGARQGRKDAKRGLEQIENIQFQSALLLEGIRSYLGNGKRTSSGSNQNDEGGRRGAGDMGSQQGDRSGKSLQLDSFGLEGIEVDQAGTVGKSIGAQDSDIGSFEIGSFLAQGDCPSSAEGNRGSDGKSSMSNERGQGNQDGLDAHLGFGDESIEFGGPLFFESDGEGQGPEDSGPILGNGKGNENRKEGGRAQDGGIMEGSRGNQGNEKHGLRDEMGSSLGGEGGYEGIELGADSSIGQGWW